MANRIFTNGARFACSRSTTWKLVNWRRQDNNFGDTSAMLRAFSGDRATAVFCMASLAGR